MRPSGPPLDVAEVDRHRRGARFGCPLEVLESVGSTNDIVLERAVAGATPGLVVAAERQTAGRGRRGRTFDSRPGLGLWFSVLLEPPADPATAPRAALIAGVAVADAIAELPGASPRLKWPNDVRLGGRKVCGILVEARTVGRRIFLVAGIGINVHHRAEDFPPELTGAAGSLESVLGRSVARSRLLAGVLDRLEVRFEADATGRLDLPGAFEARDDLAGREVEIDGPGRRCRGIAAGIAPDGGLRLRVPGEGLVIVRSGEASLVAVG